MRFALEGGNISIQKIAQNIYNYMVDQSGCREMHIPLQGQEGSSVSISKILSKAPASFRFFERLYLEGRSERFKAYSGKIEYIFRKGKRLDVISQIRGVEKVFNSKVLKFASPSALLTCAAKANYWETIDLLVDAGGKIDNFSESASQSDPMQTEWINVYSRAFEARIKELSRLESSLNGKAASKKKAESINPSSSSSAGYISSSKDALR